MKRVLLVLALVAAFCVPARAGDIHIPPDCPPEMACTASAPEPSLLDELLEALGLNP